MSWLPRGFPRIAESLKRVGGKNLRLSEKTTIGFKRIVFLQVTFALLLSVVGCTNLFAQNFESVEAGYFRKGQPTLGTRHDVVVFLSTSKFAAVELLSTDAELLGTSCFVGVDKRGRLDEAKSFAKKLGANAVLLEVGPPVKRHRIISPDLPSWSGGRVNPKTDQPPPSKRDRIILNADSEVVQDVRRYCASFWIADDLAVRHPMTAK